MRGAASPRKSACVLGSKRRGLPARITRRSRGADLTTTRLLLPPGERRKSRDGALCPLRVGRWFSGTLDRAHRGTPQP
jgi:hypothetical protein